MPAEQPRRVNDHGYWACVRRAPQSDARLQEGVATPPVCPEEYMAVDVLAPEVGAPGKCAAEGRQQPAIGHLLWPQNCSSTGAKIDGDEIVAISGITAQRDGR